MQSHFGSFSYVPLTACVALLSIYSNASAQGCGPWASIKSWNGTFTLAASGSGQIEGGGVVTINDQISANVTSSAEPDGCTAGAALNASNSSASVSNVLVSSCGTTTFTGNNLDASSISLTIDPSKNSYAIDSIVFAMVTMVVTDKCPPFASGTNVVGYTIGLADPNAPLGVFPLPKTVGVLQQSTFSFTAPAQFSYGVPLTWTLSFKLVPSSPWVKVWMSGGKSGQAAVHQPSEIRVK